MSYHMLCEINGLKWVIYCCADTEAFALRMARSWLSASDKIISVRKEEDKLYGVSMFYNVLCEMNDIKWMMCVFANTEIRAVEMAKTFMSDSDKIISVEKVEHKLLVLEKKKINYTDQTAPV